MNVIMVENVNFQQNIETTLVTTKGVTFNKKKSKQAAKYVIIMYEE
jgi:hypothetical protein